MLIYSQAPGPAKCRYVSVPTCERECDASTDVEALATFQMRLRDALDFTVDFTEWLAANGNPTLTNAQFTVAQGSPQTPSVAGQAFNAAGKAVIVLSPGEGRAVGDAYYLDINASVGATVPVSPTDVATPSRSLVRRIHVVVVNG